MAKTRAKTNTEKKTRIPNYKPSLIETKWQEYWLKNRIYQPNLDDAKKPFYNLMMFPYPSAEGMHVGNMYAFTGSDVYGRFKRMQGFDVFEPIGLDGFGIHSENYALKVGRHPKDQAKISQENFYRQLRATGNSFAWENKLETYDPDYYKWTQWIFIQLFRKGLAYRKKALVNFCPSCKTVLADEQVISGRCERCGTEVIKKELKQWFFKITEYAERLLNNIEKLDWTEKVKIAQKQWIGRSEGAIIRFKIKDSRIKDTEIEVFTTRPDTLYGATFLVLAPEHFLSSQIARDNKEAEKYIRNAQNKTEQERIAEGKGKRGIDTGLKALNPATKEEIPIFIADYVVMGYGTGAIMAVPAHDQRDFEFAQKYNLDIRFVIKPLNGKLDAGKAYTGPGQIINSGDNWNDYYVPDAIPKIIDDLEKWGIGKRQVQYHLRDWLISRQRYWGPPIPLVFCENCAKKIRNPKFRIQIKKEFSKGELENPGWIAVKEKDLPVLLPDVKDWKPTGTGKSPLASIETFVKTKCPNCKGSAIRETDVSDTFLDSAWYFFRYLSPDKKEIIFDKKRVEKWLPVSMYIGGAEHSVLHLLYSRFITMVFKDLGLISFEEPYSRFRAHGLLIKEGAKMSKSRGNVVVPDAYIRKFGADTLRLYLMFLGPFTQGGDFYDTGIEGMHRFVKRVWKLVQENSEFKSQKSKPTIEAQRMMHKTIKRVTEDIEGLRYNTAIAALMEYYNFLSKQQTVSKNEIEALILLISPFAPHMAEELWQLMGYKNSVNETAWPKFSEEFLIEKNATIVLQINGKTRDTFIVEMDKIEDKQTIEKIAKQREKAQKYLKNRQIKNTIYVKGKIINFVVNN